MKSAVVAAGFPGFGESFRTIACQEFATDFFLELLFMNGQLFSPENLCNGLSVSEPYDSKNFQIEAPIIYFEGTNDAATPMNQARHHFSHQSKSQKSFVTVGEAGHNPLQLSLYGCKAALWEAILEKHKLSSADLQSCVWAWPVTVENK